MTDQAQRLREIVDMLKHKRIKNEENKNRIVTITSGKGGVGKTTFTCNLAIALSNMGFKVLIIDADFGLANVDVMLGVTVEHNFSSVLDSSKSIKDIIADGPNNVKIISGGAGLKELIEIKDDKVEQYIENLMKLEDVADIILVDTGAGINENVLKFILSSNEVILITTPEPTALMDVYALTKTVARMNSSINLKLVVNMAKNEKEAKSTLENFIVLAKSFLNINITSLGYLLEDKAVTEAVRLQEPFAISFPKSEVANNMLKIANTFIDLPVSEKSKNSLQSFIKRLFVK